MTAAPPDYWLNENPIAGELEEYENDYEYRYYVYFGKFLSEKGKGTFEITGQYQISEPSRPEHLCG